MADEEKQKRKIRRLSLEDLEKRLAPGPVWAAGAFSGPSEQALDNANGNAAFFKFADHEHNDHGHGNGKGVGHEDHGKGKGLGHDKHHDDGPEPTSPPPPPEYTSPPPPPEYTSPPPPPGY